MITLNTESGWTFHSQAFVTIRGRVYDMDEITPEQRAWVNTMLNIQGMNAAFTGERIYRPAEPLPSTEEVFPDLAEAENGAAG